jgi:membrane peptidoglycan carboxypeptidase
MRRGRQEFKGRTVSVAQKPAPPCSAPRGKTAGPKPADHVELLQLGTTAATASLDTPLLSSTRRSGEAPPRGASLPPHVINAGAGHRGSPHYYHPGIDPIRLTGAVFYSMVGDSRISATSTITQQLVRNVFLPQFEGWSLQQARERSTRRKLLEMWVSLVMSRRATKDEILEMYLNAVPLGQRGSFAIVGVSEAARLFFAKDVSNLSIAEAATMAGVIQSPSALSPSQPDALPRSPERVIRAMADAGSSPPSRPRLHRSEPLTVVQRALEAEAPHSSTTSHRR